MVVSVHYFLCTGEKPFHCDECEYVTADHNSLRRHKMRHSGDKPYKCPHCPYACIQSSTYKAHLNTKHPGEWVYLHGYVQNFDTVLKIICYFLADQELRQADRQACCVCELGKTGCLFRCVHQFTVTLQVTCL